MTTERHEKATFAGGCFWCMVSPFDRRDGVLSVQAGYTGGHKEHPTYEEVCSGRTGHTEAVQIVYDPARVSFEELLEIFWRNIDPTTPDRQFADVGSQYRPGVFYHTEGQRRQAEASRNRLATSGRFGGDIAVEITPASEFYPAEEYHQDFYVKNPTRYKRYSEGSGRVSFLNRAWKDEKESS